MTDSNDWRVTVTLPSPAHASRAQRAFSEQAVEADLRRLLGRGIAVGSGEHQVFLYAGTQIAASEAERVARDVLTKLGMDADIQVHRWHPIEEEWEAPDVALPQTEAERQAEHQRLEDAETAASLASGIAQWQARAELPSHRDAIALADKLRGEGRPVIRRWKFLVVSANDEDDAKAVAERIMREAPPGATVRTEASGMRLPFIPF